MPAREGYSILVIITVILMVVIALMIAVPSPLVVILLVLSGSMLLFSLYFFRDPRREVERNDKKILSPADGKVVRIIEVNDPEIGSEVRLISIFLSVFNVHANRMPVTGKFGMVQYKKGKFLAAFDHNASDVNEQTDILIHSEHGKLRVKQIAGILARRILCYARQDAEMGQGDRLGFIRFGSRTDLIVPQNVKINVKVGQKVTGNQTVMGEFE